MSWLWLLVIVAPATAACVAFKDPDWLTFLDELPAPRWRKTPPRAHGGAGEPRTAAGLACETGARRDMPMAPVGRHAAGLARVTLPSAQPGSLPRVRADGCPWATGPMPVIGADR